MITDRIVKRLLHNEIATKRKTNPGNKISKAKKDLESSDSSLEIEEEEKEEQEPRD